MKAVENRMDSMASIAENEDEVCPVFNTNVNNRPANPSIIITIPVTLFKIIILDFQYGEVVTEITFG